MNKEITHITELTRKDLREIAAATDPQPGFLIRVTNTPNGLEIAVDENAFKTAVFGFLHNLGAIYPITPSQETISQTSCVPS